MTDNVLKFFDRIIENNQVGHAYLIEVGDDYDTSFSYEIAKKILFFNDSRRNGEKVNSQFMDDIKIIRPDGKNIKKDQLLELMSDFKMISSEGNKRCYIIEFAENLNQTSANTILKFLEEPENDIVAILVSKNIYNVLDTIVSRCQILRAKTNFYKNYNTKTMVQAIEYFKVLISKRQKAIAFFSDLYTLKADELKEILEIWLLMFHEMLNEKYIGKKPNKIISDADLSNLDNNITIEELIDMIKTIEKMIILLDYNVNTRVILDKLFVGGD